ncbi:MAG: hypothetical protein V3V99_08230 [candidate division Zixibacteria bacterium]
MRDNSFVKIILLILAVCLAPSTLSVLAQTTDLPDVEMVIDNFDYMISLFPDDYDSRRHAVRACSTITPVAESLKVFWEEQGDIVLYYLSYYAGINWVEPEFKIYLVKYYPDYANHNPMTIPLAGKKDGDRIIALPRGLSHYLTLFRQLAKRLLDQASLPGSGNYYIAGHPLLRKTPRRFDNMANLLALRTLSDFTNVDTLMAVFKSAHWKKREPGQEVFFNYFWDNWHLSEDSTLASYIANEPYGSRLVALTRPPVTRPRESGWGDHQLQAPPGGQLGFSVARDRSGFFRVVEIDSFKLAFVSGLRTDDLIRNIDGTAPRNIKALFTLILNKLPDGAHVNIVRNDEPESVIIHLWSDLPDDLELYYERQQSEIYDSTDQE